ncbi:cytochrome c oxidase assembly factor Coa1 family protein [Rhizomicrobium electricum]|jgi:hypothetical protein|uniref:cytochrome c oxidase assembly factor Coa1 family protein n=1 Tax=Rhizomicrobium electricum TaxID=480070 RepID=UPI001420E3D4|nr:cytochrome c oxidase assembly factor Coa1 family protein [Rhizomicrobium electricum]NIJ48636.1 hypothetical protein [Rhizomicrobium electricum]
MSQTAEQQDAPPPRPRHGCLYGCLGALVAIVVVVAAVYTFSARYFFKVLDNDAQIKTIVATLNQNPEAQSVLGRNITVMSRERVSFHSETGVGSTASYTLKVVGSNGEGEAKANLDVAGGKAKITSLVLTDAQGRDHYIVGAAPPSPMMQNSI